MAKKNFYAVKVGKKTGVFTSWEECEQSVKGYPNAKYKGFALEEEALAYLGLDKRKVKEDVAESSKKVSLDAHEISNSMFTADTNGNLVAYVDGSFEASTGVYAFGCVFLLPDGRILHANGSGNQPETAAIRNVAGEMLGAMYAVGSAALNGYSSIHICYDYVGIENWAAGKWKAKNPYTQKYAKYMKEKAKTIQISFQKIAAHTGEQYNEKADQLAKEALEKPCGIPKLMRWEK